MDKNKMRALKLNPKKRDGWLKIGTTGRWDGHVAGSFELDERDYNQMIFNARQRALDIVVDYEHATIYNPDKAPAAGWISVPDLKVEDGDLYCKITWTETAAKHIDKKEYKYLSPVFVRGSYDQVSDKNIGWTLHSVALTNKPFLSELGTIANKQLQNKEKDMSKSLQEQLDAERKKTENLVEEVKDLKQQIEEKDKIIAASDKAAADAVISEAISTGKLDEKQKAWAESYALSDKEGFSEYMKTLAPKSAAPEGEMFHNSDSQNGGDTHVAIELSKV